MLLGEIERGLWVVYQPHPGAEKEDGIVTEIRRTNVMVRYTSGPQKGRVCATDAADLSYGDWTRARRRS